MRKIERMLNVASDMERFTESQDELSRIVSLEDDELLEDSLELISAAGSKPSFQDLIKKLEH